MNNWLWQKGKTKNMYESVPFWHLFLLVFNTSADSKILYRDEKKLVAVMTAKIHWDQVEGDNPYSVINLKQLHILNFFC